MPLGLPETSLSPADAWYADLASCGRHRDDASGAPDLVVEVMSPHPRIGKLDERIHCFAQYGVKECWLVHQLSREIEVLRLQEHGADSRRVFCGIQRIGSSVLPDFGISPEIVSCW